MRKKNPKNKILLMIAVLVSSALMCSVPDGLGGAASKPTPGPLSAAVAAVEGTVQVLKSDGIFVDSFVGQEILASEQVLTHTDSGVRIDLSETATLRAGALTTFMIAEMENRPDGPFARLKMNAGTLWVVLRSGRLEVETPLGTAEVRGSYMQVQVDNGNGETYITCLEGECRLGNALGQVVLGAGQTARLSDSASEAATGWMSAAEVERWLDANPEATQVLAQLTPAGPTEIAAGGDAPLDCGPPEGWVLYTVLPGDTLQMVAVRYFVTPADIQAANCMGDSTAIVAGQGLFVPDVPTQVPAVTPTPHQLPPTGFREGYLLTNVRLERLENGETVFLSSYIGQPMIINVWATWCGPCVEEMPYLQQVYERFQEDGLIVVAVNYIIEDDINSVQAFVDEHGLTFPVLLDSDGVFIDSYGIEGIPMSYFVDRYGVIQDVVLGDRTESFFVQGVDALLAVP